MKKLLKSQKFAPELDVTIDTSKVQMDVIKPWVATRVTELLGFEDEVLINFIYGMLEEKNVDGKHVQIQLTGFMEKNTGKFMKDLWSLLISAQSNVSGIPQQFLDQKAEETRLKKIESERIAAELQRKRDLDKLADEERQREKVSSGTVEKTRTEKKKEKKENEMKKGSSSDPADSEVGDPSATPPSAPENKRSIYFQYAEGSMNLMIMVQKDFDASLTSFEIKQVFAQVSDIYCSRLGVTSRVSDMKFNFTLLSPDRMLVALKDDEMELGFKNQVKTYRTSLSDSLITFQSFRMSLDGGFLSKMLGRSSCRSWG